MIKAIHHTRIKSPISKVRIWFKNELPYNYLTIHPTDHLELTKLDEKPIQTGSLFKLREKIGGRFYLSTRIKVVHLTENSFTFIGLFPYTLINLKARFKLRSISKNVTEVTAENYAGYDWPVMGGLLDLLITCFLPYKVLKRHMLEENMGIQTQIENYK